MLLLLGSESLDESGEVKSPTAENIKVYTAQIQDLVIAQLNAAISCKLLQLVNVLHDSYTGHLFIQLVFTPPRYRSKVLRSVCLCVCLSIC